MVINLCGEFSQRIRQKVPFFFCAMAVEQI